MLLIFFIFGICLGSFTTVLITRIPIGEDFVFSRSRCPNCAKKLGATELIPLLSWVMLKAKCKNCKTKISSFYPLSELIVGFLAIFAFFLESNLILAMLLALIFAIFYALGAIDFRLKAVPNYLLMSGYFLAVLYASITQINNILDSFIIIGIMVILKSTLMLRPHHQILEPMGEADSIFIASMVAILGLEWGFIALFLGALVQLFIHISIKDKTIAFIPALFGGFIVAASLKNFTNINLGLI
ncbi:prepilin peptidase [Campylobacter devanensis]|uniref:prepilin peptidase n=1 Tax=Campylobacter devanensis TaxID=3161138 RepID=UPI000A32F4C2|nr:MULTISPECIES: A24 family peptidase [unclassified Campylobacter]